MRFPLRLLFLCGLLAPQTSTAGIVYTDSLGRQWLDLTDTTNWTAPVSACDKQTGQCSGVVGSVNLDGFVWASRDEVRELYYEIGQLPPGVLDDYSHGLPVGDHSAELALSIMPPTGSVSHDGRCIDLFNQGFTRTEYVAGSGNYFIGVIYDSGPQVSGPPGICGDTSGGAFSLDGASNEIVGLRYRGVYLYRPADVVGTKLANLTLKTSEVAGCKSAKGTVTIDGPAPVGGVVVTVSDSMASATAPAKVTVPAGATTKNFSITTSAVASSESGEVSATLGGTTLSQDLTVRPMGVSSLTFATIPTGSAAAENVSTDETHTGDEATPNVIIVGGTTLAGSAKLECKAAPGPMLVEVSSSMPAVASPDVPSVLVPAGAQTATFNVLTAPVAARTKPIISATANGITKSKVLTLNPPTP